MVDVNDAPIAELVNHAQLEQRVPLYLCARRLLQRYLINLESLCEVLQTGRSVVHEVGQLETRFVLSLLLVKCQLEISECQLLIEIEFGDVKSGQPFAFAGGRIKHLASYLAKQGLLCHEDGELLQEERRVEGCHTLTHLGELHIEPRGLRIAALLDEFVSALHVY